MPMQGNEIRHEGQPVALVLGETLEAAQHGARLLGITYERAAFRAPGTSEVEAPDPASGYVGYFEGSEFRKGDIEASLATAATRHEAVSSSRPDTATPWSPARSLLAGTTPGSPSSTPFARL